MRVKVGIEIECINTLISSSEALLNTITTKIVHVIVEYPKKRIK